MRFVIFTHSLRSDWNHGNAHFLRGVITELTRRGHEAVAYEPRDAWSVQSLVQEAGVAGLRRWREHYPDLRVRLYDLPTLDLDHALRDADVVLVHEWSDPALVARIGEHRGRAGGYVLLFHDTHHRIVTKPEEMRAYDLRHYDGVLAFGDVVRDLYLERGLARQAWTWHEAADPRVFRPVEGVAQEGDLVWVGNWGDEERTRELREFLLEPVRELRLKARVHGVRYPEEAKRALAEAGIDYRGWIANPDVPGAFAAHRVTLHVPRRPYVECLPGIPTIRVFEALACGIPLVSAPWRDAEGLFTPGKDFLVAQDGREMRRHLRDLLDAPDEARRMAQRGRQTVLARHTCAHRAEELLRIVERLRGGAPRAEAPAQLAPAAASGSGGRRIRMAFFGSSLVSSYWNGAATYYRGILHALARRGCDVTFYEPDAYERQAHRDMADPDWARVVVYPNREEAARRCVAEARAADVVVKASGVGVFDALLEREVLALRRDGTKVVFWDVDAPATLDRMGADRDDPFRHLVPEYDLVLTYGGGDPVVKAYEGYGARRCVPVYNALDPATHHPVPPEPRFEADLGLLANRLPDREARIEEFFLKPAAALAGKRFLLGGNGWEDKPVPPNVRKLGHVGTGDHNAFNCTPRAVLNVNRESMARYGFSPPTRVFEAAGAGACLVSDHWEGIDLFLEPGREVLVAREGADVARILADLTPERARQIGERARARILREHTYDQRADQVLRIFREAGL